MQIIGVVKIGLMQAIKQWKKDGVAHRSGTPSVRSACAPIKNLRPPPSVPTNFSLKSESCLNGEDGDLWFEEFFN